MLSVEMVKVRLPAGGPDFNAKKKGSEETRRGKEILIFSLQGERRRK